MFLVWALPLLAEIRIAQGRFEEALRLATEAEQCGGPHNRLALLVVHGVRARAHARLGAVQEARGAAVAAVAAAAETDSLVDQALTQEALAEALAAAGELPAALAAAEEAARLFTSLERMLLARRATALVEEIERRSARITEPTTAG